MLYREKGAHLRGERLSPRQPSKFWAVSLCVLADSAGAADILDAIRAERYAVFAPNAHVLALNVGDAGLGETVSWDDAREVELALDGLAPAMSRVLQPGSEVLAQMPCPGRWKGSYRLPAPGSRG